MSAKIIDGKLLAERLCDKVRADAEEVALKLGRAPTLAVVLVGDNPASHVYVKAKTARARKCGINVVDVFLPSDAGDRQLQHELQLLSKRQDLDGILLQLPLPRGYDEFAAICNIAPELDVDGLHPLNQGLLLRGFADLGIQRLGFTPCTPKGCLFLVEEALQLIHGPTAKKQSIAGLNAVVLGRSILVGKPAAVLLLQANCTATICHSQSRDWREHTRRADILIAAVGRERLVKAQDIAPGAIVIDVGINRTENGELVGDVDFDAVAQVAAAITPVPGGVGPMTIAVLMQNTVLSAARKTQ